MKIVRFAGKLTVDGYTRVLIFFEITGLTRTSQKDYPPPVNSLEGMC